MDYYSIFIIIIGMMILLVINGEKNLYYYAVLFVIALLCAACYSNSIAFDIKAEHSLNMIYKQNAADEEINIEQEPGEPPLPDHISWEIYEGLDPLTKKGIHDVYDRYLGPVVQRFGFERVFEKYNFSLVVKELSAARPMKRAFAEMAFEDATTMERLFGYEYITLVESYEIEDKNGELVMKEFIYDLENDFPSVFYYSGYVGFALYMLFLAYFIGLIIVAVITRFKKVVNIENGALLISLGLLLGAAQYSANVLRRPNASIYLSVVLAYVYYNTAVKENVKYRDVFRIFKRKKKA